MNILKVFLLFGDFLENFDNQKFDLFNFLHCYGANPTRLVVFQTWFYMFSLLYSSYIKFKPWQNLFLFVRFSYCRGPPTWSNKLSRPGQPRRQEQLQQPLLRPRHQVQTPQQLGKEQRHLPAEQTINFLR